MNRSRTSEIGSSRKVTKDLTRNRRGIRGGRESGIEKKLAGAETDKPRRNLENWFDQIETSNHGVRQRGIEGARRIGRGKGRRHKRMGNKGAGDSGKKAWQEGKRQRKDR